MKLLLTVLFLCLSVDSYAATRKIVPRADSEGGIGTSSKKWGTSYFKYGIDVATVVASAEISGGTTTIAGATYWGANNAKSTMTFTGALTLNSGIVVNSGIAYYSRTLAQLDALTPTATGESYYCSNCVDSAVCISSGTGTGAFVQISSATVHCR